MKPEKQKFVVVYLVGLAELKLNKVYSVFSSRYTAPTALGKLRLMFFIQRF